MDVKDIKLDANRGGVIAVAYTNGVDKTPDKIKGGWFSGFNNKVTSRSTNRTGNDVGITGKELLDGAKGFGGSWVANSKVDYEYRVTEEISPEVCSSYFQLLDMPKELIKLIEDTYSKTHPLETIVSHIKSGILRYNDDPDSIGRGTRYTESETVKFSGYHLIKDIKICIEKTYRVTPTERTLINTRVTKLTYVHLSGDVLSRYEDAGGLHFNTEETFIFRDFISNTSRILNKRRRVITAS